MLVKGATCSHPMLLCMGSEVHNVVGVWTSEGTWSAASDHHSLDGRTGHRVDIPVEHTSPPNSIFFQSVVHGSVVTKWLAIVCINTLRLRQNVSLSTDDIFTCIFLNENVWISINISLKFVPQGQINNIPALVQIMAWPRRGDKPLSEPMMVSLLTHICITRPHWVNYTWRKFKEIMLVH